MEVTRPNDVRDVMLQELVTGQEKGTTTFVDEIDQCWTWRKSEANIVTGYANQGKSLFMRQLCLIKALEEDWKFVFNAPEDYPAKNFYSDMIHTLSGQTVDKDYPDCISEKMYNRCLDLIQDNFRFVYIKPPDNTMDNYMKKLGKLMDDEPFDAVLADPLMKFQRSKDAPERDDLYATHITTIGTDYARVNNICFFMIMHQLTPKKDDNGLYPKPSMYQIKNGGSFSDGIDNVLFVSRPNYAKDKIDPTVLFGSEKIKNQKLVGIPQDIELSFDRKTNRYCYTNKDKDVLDPIYNFNKWLK